MGKGKISRWVSGVRVSFRTWLIHGLIPCPLRSKGIHVLSDLYQNGIGTSSHHCAHVLMISTIRRTITSNKILFIIYNSFGSLMPLA